MQNRPGRTVAPNARAAADTVQYFSGLMAGNYTVKQGDHLSSVAKAFGFSDYHTIWDHPQNATLKHLRKNPNVLNPGDSLFIPDREKRQEARNTDQRHKFKKNVPDLKLRITLEDIYEKPIANAPCTLTLGGSSIQVTTDGTGKIEHEIAPDVHEATLLIEDAQTPFDNSPLAIKIGNLDPIDTLTGQLARLENLGYYYGNIDNPVDADVESAVEEFQCDNNLTVDGICGPVTQATLKKVHGV